MNEINIGDIITHSTYKGYFKVIDIFKEDYWDREITKVKCKLIMTSTFKKRKGGEFNYSIVWCRKVTKEELDKKIKELNEKIELINELKSEIV